MTTTLTDALPGVEPEWVQQQTRLWAGRVDGRPVGTIERGRRYTYVDVDGVARSGHRTLSAAQAAWRGSLPAPVARVWPMVRAFLASAGVASVCVGVLLTIALLAQR
ncbi:hypothetical protein [uncultured Amnibacterium sp.]|uniref:hypothetical protein n=1 Tax=uncultured Amnibacterium sp. TaxID=1631851 RepID=UPI0035CC9E33